MDNTERVVLTSPEPFEGKHASFWFFLLLLIIPFIFFGLGNFFDFESTLGMICTILGVISLIAVIVLYTLDYKATVKHMTEIQSMKFKFISTTTPDEICSKLEPALRNFHGENVKIVHDTDNVAVIHGGIKYRIIINDDASFSVRWQKSFLDKALSIFAAIADRDGEAEPTWKYNKIRVETPIIAYSLQRAFNIATTLEPHNQSIQEIYEQAKLSAGNANVTTTSEPHNQSIQKIYEQAKRSASNANVTQSSRETSSTPTFSRKKKILAAILISIAGLMIILASYANRTPKTVDEFIKQYNIEIQRTAGKILADKYRGQGMLVEYCTLDNVVAAEGYKYKSLYKDSIYFLGFDAGYRNRDLDEHSIEIDFNFYDAPANAVVAIIGAAISAAGDDEEQVTRALNISKENNYAIPYGYNKTIVVDNKEYSMVYFDTGFNFSVRIHNESDVPQKDNEYLLGSHADGRKAYLLTDTVEYFTRMHGDGDEPGYTCTVKNVSANSAVDYDYYEISWYQTEVLIKNGESYGMRGMSLIYDMPDSVEMRLIKYLRECRDKRT